jgi:type VI secretion system protein ImpE
MQAQNLLRSGDLQGALLDLQEQVRSQPENVGFRTFLFQLLAVLGKWDRALNQLDVVSNLDTATWPMLHTYKSAIQCEALRREIFAGRRRPLLLGEPPEWMALILESVRLMGEGRYDAAAPLREKAFEQAEASRGSIDEHPFEWIADADSRLGPILELILNGAYYWVPFHQIKGIEIDGPKDLRDLVWLPANFTWANGGKALGLIPVRYPGSEDSKDTAIQLARKTEWIELTDGVHRGMGQRMFLTDQDEYPLLDTRRISIE